jgi:hypothetical protein
MASYAVVGRPSTPGRTSMMTKTGSLAENWPIRELIYKEIKVALVNYSIELYIVFKENQPLCHFP